MAPELELEPFDYTLWGGNLPLTPSHEWPVLLPSTGTIDDQDEPEDERDDENEIPVRAPNDRTEAPEEFEDNDEARDLEDDPAVTLP